VSLPASRLFLSIAFCIFEGNTKDIINGKVLPLLNEYFMGDNKKIMEVFKDNREDNKKTESQNGIKEKDGVLTYVGGMVYKDSEQ
jgi:hypothetical protein